MRCQHAIGKLRCQGRAPARVWQKGELLMVRTMAVVAVLILLLGIPLWMKSERDKRADASSKKEGTAMTGAAPTAAPGRTLPASGAAPAVAGGTAGGGMGHGLTYAVVVDETAVPAEVVRLGCHGEPKATDLPLPDSPCNPGQGDTSCRVVLPVLCIQPGMAAKPAGGSEATYTGWTGGALASTQPVMGAILTSAALASARCEKELGSGWRMADEQDGLASGGLQGLRTANTSLDRGTRYWVQVKDKPANCWNSGS